jgi:hypothetical protein
VAAEAQKQFARVGAILQQQGWPIGASETLQDYLDRVTTSYHACGHPDTALIPALNRFAQTYTRLRFQPYPTTPETDVSIVMQEQLIRLHDLADQIVRIGTTLSRRTSPESSYNKNDGS